MPRSSLLLTFACACCAVLGASPAHAAPAEFDAFLLDRADRPVPELKAVATAADRWAVQGQVSATEPRFGVPSFFWAWRSSGGERTLRAMGLNAVQAARRHLVAHASLYRTTAGHLAEARVAHVHDLGDGGAVIVSFQQDVKGVRVFRDEVRVVMTPQLELVALSGALTPQLKPLGTFELTFETAVTVAYQDLTNTGRESVPLKALGVEGGWQLFALAEQPTPARARSVWYPRVSGLEPAYQLELDASVGTDDLVYSYVVSARDGAVLSRHSLTAADAYSYRLWVDPVPPHFPLDGPQGAGPTPHPTGRPDGYRPTFVPSTLVTVANGPISTNDPWLPAGASVTNGNNVKAYADLKAPNGFGGADVLGTASGPGAFDYAYDPAAAPGASTTQQQAAVTSLFYVINFLHDWFYDVGFDEKAGNGQASNLGRGGREKDALQAEGQDYSGTDNANMSTPADGASPRMQMYVWSGMTVHTLTVATAPAQAFAVGAAAFGPKLYDVTAPMQLVDDRVEGAESTEGPGTLTDGCETYPAPLTGKIALVDRGFCTFVQKAQRAQAAGAVGLVVMDNVDDARPVGMAGTATLQIPSLSVTQAAGRILRELDGISGTMTSADRQKADGTIDNSIVAHEWGHYLSNRLIGDSVGLGNQQGTGMGEGWSDFTALLMLVRAEDAQAPANAGWAGSYGLAAYAGFAAMTSEGYYYGIRRMPYSTDLAKNSLTFMHIEKGVPLATTAPMLYGSTGADNEEVHNTGEVWANLLWECYASLLRDPRYTFEQARDRMRGYLVASLKATPNLPTLIEARDALLSVAAAKDQGDFGLFWRAFASRGMGMGAVGPTRESATNGPVTESFVVGNSLAVTRVSVDDGTQSCDADGQLDANERGTLSVVVKNVGIGAVTGAQLSVTTGLAAFTFTSGATATLPALQPFESTTVRVPVALGDVAGIARGALTVSLTEPSLIRSPVVDTAQLVLNFDLKPTATALDDVEAPMSQWSSSADPKGDTGTVFKRYENSPTEHWWYGPSSAFASTTYLVSPVLQVATGLPLVIEFKHRFDFEQEVVSETSTVHYDGAVVELTEDEGATWVNVGSSAMPAYNGTISAVDGTKQSANELDGKKAWVGRSPQYPAFVPVAVDLGTRYAGKTVQVRFRQSTDDNLGAKGWELDDLGFRGIINRPFTAVVSDPNTCTNKAPVVTVGADQEVLEGTSVTLSATASDADGDALTRTWTQVSGARVTLTDERFTAPAVKTDSQLIFELTVTDGRAVVGPLNAKVLVKTKNRAPVASAPATVSANAGSPVSIEGSGTDPDGDALTYEWTQVSGPAVTLKAADTAKVGFDAPKDANQTIVLQLVVRDEGLGSEPAQVTVSVKNACGCGTGLEGGFGVLALLALALRRRRS